MDKSLLESWRCGDPMLGVGSCLGIAIFFSDDHLFMQQVKSPHRTPLTRAAAGELAIIPSSSGDPPLAGAPIPRPTSTRPGGEISGRATAYLNHSPRGEIRVQMILGIPGIATRIRTHRRQDTTGGYRVGYVRERVPLDLPVPVLDFF